MCICRLLMSYSTQACDGCPRFATCRLDPRQHPRPCLAILVSLAGSAPGGSERRPLALDQKVPIVQPRNTPPVSLPREAIHVEPRTARYKARHSIRKPRKWKPAAVAAGGAGAIIAITAVGSAAHWAAGAASLTADLRHIPNAGS